MPADKEWFQIIQNDYLEFYFKTKDIKIASKMWQEQQVTEHFSKKENH